MAISVFIIDTFTSEAFKGNPTAVCLSGEKLSAETRLAIAGELNLPVTAFLEPLPERGAYAISYFTPTTEIPACGHATLAAAQVALATGRHQNAKFLTAAKMVISTVSENDYSTLVYPKFGLAEFAVTDEILASLALRDYRSAGVCAELEALFIELADENLLKALRPDFKRMVAAGERIKEIVVTCRSRDARYDFLLRSFCPWIGIDEDPVTGSVHSVLAGFWEARLGKTELRAYQASARGGELFVRSLGDRVELGGRSVAILKGEITI
jgi:PhzF family phenazine biosynthesis protein